MLRAVFLDFDGVIKESLDIKTDAFVALFAPWGEEVTEKVRKHHVANGGMSRYRKIPMYLREYCVHAGENGEVDQALADKLLADFAERVVEEVIRAPLVPGVVEFIRGCTEGGTPVAIISGAPHDELCSIIERMGMGADFARIYGSPRDKDELLKLALQDFDCKAEETLFIGDSINDYTPAKALMVPFAARVRSDRDDHFPEDVYRIADFVGMSAQVLYRAVCHHRSLFP